MSNAPYDVSRYRADFPILSQQVHGNPLIYLDNAASAQKPRAVIDAVSSCYETAYANVHRGVHYMSQLATENMEAAREKARAFVNATHVEEIIWVRGATEGINLVASSWAAEFMGEGDEMILSTMEHHSNIVPWQLAQGRRGFEMKVAPINDAGELMMDEYKALFGPRTKLVALTHVSNALGTVVPIAEAIRIAHEHGALVLVDGCQAAPHIAIDVQAMDADFYVLSGHKIYGPSGIGILYGKKEHLEAMPPYHGGGDMIDTVTFEKTTFAGLPFKFEAGTPNIADSIGMGAAIDYITEIGLEAIAAHEDDLLSYATERLQAFNDIRLIGTADDKTSIVSFLLDDIHPHDIGTILDQSGIAVRTGHHCAQPVMDRFDIPSTVRASFALYNTRGDVDALIDGLAKVREIFG